MTTIALTDGLKFYLGDRANKAAVNLMAEDRGPPADFELDELDTYFTAALAAERVKLELWRFLRRIWSETWGEAMTAVPLATLLNFGEHQQVAGADYRPNLFWAWSLKETYGVYALPRERAFLTGVWLSNQERTVGLFCSLVDSSGATHRAFTPMSGWSMDDDEWFVCSPTQPDLIKDLQLDLSPFKEAAEAAVGALIDVFDEPVG